VFDHGRVAGEAGQVAVLGQDGRVTQSGQTNAMEQTSSVSCSSSRTSTHAGLSLALASSGVAEVIQQQRDPLQRAGAVSGHPPGVSSGREQQPYDSKTRHFPLPGNDFSSYRSLP